MLPPGLERRPVHQYGQFIISINNISIPNVLVETAELSLLGMKEPTRIQISMEQQSRFVFGIGTNLWHFYAYLNDARALGIRLIDVKNRTYTCQMHLNLMASHQVLSKNPNNLSRLFEQNGYLQDWKEKCQVFDSRFAKVGDISIELNLSLYEAINRTLLQANLIDFQQILVIDEISPISSKIDLNNMTQHIQEIVPIPISSIKAPIYNVPQSLRHLQQQLKTPIPQVKAVPQVKLQDPEPSFIQDEKMIQDDIDRLIAQMQNRPYDSSKYMEEAKEEPRKENFNYANFSLVTAKSQSNQKRAERVPSTEKHPLRVPPMMKTISSRPEFNVSPQPKLAYTASNPTIGISPMRSLSQTQVTNQSQSNRQMDRKSGLIKLKIHEFTMSKIEQELSLLLKIYLNDDIEEFYTINGLRQGETISFNSNMKINQKRQITTIRFVLIDTFDMKTIFAQGTFQMSRLFSLNPTKGIFMVSLISAPPVQNQSKIIRMEQQSLVRVTPNIKNLRIELQYQQTIQIVQIYLSLSDFSNACRKVSYKVPFTKESIEFRVAQLNSNKHINIFPHNRNATSKANDKIIIQLWGETELIGLNQINLKPLSNTNQMIINSSLQPIFLYDQAEDVFDLKTGKNRASYWLKLFYGNISQVQNILNRDDKERKPEKPKTMIAVENHLGIYIKESKVQKQVEIQVDEGEMRQTWKGSQKNILSLQQQELPDDDEEQVQIADHKSNISQNEFISESMEQKYLKNKETLPILRSNEQQSISQAKSLQFSKTIKPKALRSLTKQFQQQIKSALSNLASQQVFAQLKEECKPYLLFHFIQLQNLTTIMRDIGIHQDNITFLLNDVILVSNEMINVNILYDMIFGLILEGEVKEKLIDDVQIGRYCLMTLYKSLKQDDYGEEEIFLFDQNTEFDESRKIYQKIDYKLTMREFNLVHSFINKKQEEQKFSSAKLRQQLLNKHELKVKAVEIKQAKQKEIISKLYHHEWDEDDDFFICNINQREVEEPSRIMTNNDIYSDKNHQNDNTGSFHATNIKESIRFQDPSLTSIKYNKLETSKSNNQLAETFKPPQKQKVNANFKLIIQGFATSCIDTIQCLLNASLTLPQLRVFCRGPSQDKEFWINKTSNEDRYQIELFLDDEFVDGSIEFHDNGQCIARCNISIMSNMKSCYTLKNVETFQYCGIINILLSPL